MYAVASAGLEDEILFELGSDLRLKFARGLIHLPQQIVSAGLGLKADRVEDRLCGLAVVAGYEKRRAQTEFDARRIWEVFRGGPKCSYRIFDTSCIQKGRAEVDSVILVRGFHPNRFGEGARRRPLSCRSFLPPYPEGWHRLRLESFEETGLRTGIRLRQPAALRCVRSPEEFLAVNSFQARAVLCASLELV